MADEKDLKKMLDDWQTRMGADTKLVDQINEYLNAEYDQKGTPAKDRKLLGTDEPTRKAYAEAVRKETEEAIGSSPGLKADFIKEIGDGRIKKLEIAPRGLGAGGAYDGGNDTMLINPMIALMAGQKDKDKSMLPLHREMIGIIGHELDHSQERDKGRAEFNTFKTEAEKILNDGKDNHDFTKVIGDQITARSASESRAQLDYYNSIVLSLPEKDRTDAKIFAAIPDDRKKDFFDTDKGTLLPGLKIDPPGSGLLPQTADNIKSMEKSFFERPQFGPTNRETYKEQVAAELVKTIVSVDTAKEVTINLKAMGVDYNAIQPYLKDIAPPKTFYDNSDGTKVKLETDKPLVVVAPAKAEPSKTEPSKAETPKTDAPKTDAPKSETPKSESPKVEPPKTPDGGGKQKLPDTGMVEDGREHPLFSQALRHLKAMGPEQGGYANPQDMQRIAGAVAEAAQQRPLASIDSLHASADGKGLIASWTNPGNPLDSDRVGVDKAQARAQPLEQSLQRLDVAEQRPETPQPVHAQSTGMTR
jgi:hypothetical protein